jgi:fibronectin-binding autotransporter adhesin
MRLLRGTVLLILALGFCNVRTYGQTATWTDGNGDWSNPANWTPTGSPNSPTTNVFITDGTSTVTLDTSASVASLQLASGNTLTLSPSTPPITLTVNGPQILNDGQINDNSFLNIVGNTSLQGTGALTLGGGRINGGTLTNQSTIQGTGDFFTSAVVNDVGGTIDANVSGQYLGLPLVTLTNTGGTLEASNGGTLALDYTHAIDNQNGTIEAIGAGSVVEFNSGSQIEGGTLTTTAGGTMGPLGGDFGIFLDGSTQGALTLSTGSTWTSTGTSTTVLGTIINNGNMLFGGGSFEQASMTIGGNTTLQGTGAVTLSENNDGFADISPFTGSYTLTNQGTIQGAGTIVGTCCGSSPTGALALINEGLIDANVSGETLTVNPTSLLNSGTLQVESGSTMSLGVGSGSVTNTGTFNVNPGGTMIFDATAGSGTITNSGAINLTSSTLTLNESGMDNVVTLVGGGTVNLSSGTIASSLAGGYLINSDNTIQGSGSINVQYFINYGDIDVVGPQGLVVNTGSNGSFSNQGLTTVNNANLTVNGNYSSIFCGTLELQNGSTGTITGTVSGSDTPNEEILVDNSSLSVGGSYGMENTTVNQGTLRIQGDVNQPDGGQIILQNGSSAVITGSLSGYGEQTSISNSTLLIQGDYGEQKFSNTTLTNGAILSVGGSVLNGEGASLFSMNGGSSALVAGDFTNDGGGVSINDSTLRVNGTFTNDGPNTITIGPAGLLSAGNYLQSGPDSPMLYGVALTDITGTLLTNSYQQSGGVTTIEIGGLIEAGSFLATGGAVTVNGTLDPTAVEIDSGATLNGTGTIIGNVAMGGTVTPGSATTPGTLAIIGNYEQIESGVFDEVISGDSSNGLLDVIGDVTLDQDSLLEITLLNGFDPLGDSFVIMDYGSLLGEFSNGSNFIADGYDWTINYGSHDAVLTAVTSAPEPATLPLLATGIFALWFCYRRKRITVGL